MDNALEAIHEEVPFDTFGAQELAGELRSLAAVLEEQSTHRPGVAGRASREWRGKHVDHFDRRLDVSVGDGRTLAAAMREAADRLDQLSDAAEAERRRRAAARSWEDEQNRRNPVVRLLDDLHDAVVGEDDSPVPEPARPPSYRAPRPPLRARY